MEHQTRAKGRNLKLPAVRRFHAVVCIAVAAAMTALESCPAEASISSPTVLKSFIPDTTQTVGGLVSLFISISHINNFALTGVSFVDTLPAGLVPTNVDVNTCGGTVTLGPTSVSLTGGTINAGQSCLVSVFLTATTMGTKINSVQVNSSVGLSNTSVATLLIVEPTPTPNTPAPAPALTPRALAVAAALLIGVAAFALRRRAVRS